MNEETVYQIVGQRPHCDPRVLHAPGTCRYCDNHPQEQALRVLWRINFTGEAKADFRPCPSEMTRTAETIHAWPGNRPAPEQL